MKNEIMEKLMEKGYKCTKQRACILDVLEKADGFLSAEDIFERVKTRNINTSFATVYRCLDLFAKKGIVNKLVFDDNVRRYELKTYQHHHHIICEKCNNTIELSACPMGDSIAEDLDRKGFMITGHRFEIYGVCSKCQNK